MNINVTGMNIGPTSTLRLDSLRLDMGDDQDRRLLGRLFNDLTDVGPEVFWKILSSAEVRRMVLSARATNEKNQP